MPDNSGEEARISDNIPEPQKPDAPSPAVPVSTEGAPPLPKRTPIENLKFILSRADEAAAKQSDGRAARDLTNASEDRFSEAQTDDAVATGEESAVEEVVSGDDLHSLDLAEAALPSDLYVQKSAIRAALDIFKEKSLDRLPQTEVYPLLRALIEGPATPAPFPRSEDSHLGERSFDSEAAKRLEELIKSQKNASN